MEVWTAMCLCFNWTHLFLALLKKVQSSFASAHDSDEFEELHSK
jgi:hypothetical protein